VEKSLSIDNLFVFVIIIGTFAVPAEHQSRALTIGIVAALILRGIFIAVGAALLDAFAVMFLIFGLALLGTAIQLFRHRDQDPSIEDNALVGAVRQAFPIADRYYGGQIIARVGGRRTLTPMLLVLVAIATTDVLFALDSIPAVFGVTQHPYIVFSANAFALLGLRALFFLVSGLLDRLIYLSIGLSLILAFIGAKLILHFAHLRDQHVPEIPTGVSLGVIALVLLVTTVVSLAKARAAPGLKAHTGSLRAQPREMRSHPHLRAPGQPRSSAKESRDPRPGMQANCTTPPPREVSPDARLDNSHQYRDGRDCVPGTLDVLGTGQTRTAASHHPADDPP
jgi:tellurite resistance protein TerC